MPVIKVLKKEANQLHDKLIELFEASGFVRVDKYYQYHKDGKHGIVDLSVHCEPRYKKQGYWVDVMGCFDDPARAIADDIECNQFSGKHNFININGLNILEYIVDQYG